MLSHTQAKTTLSFTHHWPTEKLAYKIYDRFPNVVWSTVDPLTSLSLPGSFDLPGLTLAVKIESTVRICSAKRTLTSLAYSSKKKKNEKKKKASVIQETSHRDANSGLNPVTQTHTHNIQEH